MTKEVKSYFDIFECGRNLLDQLDVTYQQALMTTPQYKYSTEMLENIVKMNNLRGEPLSNERIWQAVIDVGEETDAEHKRNINEITCDDSYQFSMKNKDVSTINESVYCESYEQVDTIIVTTSKLIQETI